MKLSTLLAVLLVAIAPVAQAQAVAAPITLRGLSTQERHLTASDLAPLARHDTTVAAHHVTGRFSGVSVIDVLRLVGAPAGDSLRGPALRTYVRVEGADGYSAILSLAEIDAGIGARAAILADRKDGAALSAADGPYQLIVPGDARPARWVRRVTGISLVRAP